MSNRETIMIGQNSTLDDYRLKKSCRKYAGVDVRNRRYLERGEKLRVISGSYEKRVAIRRKIGTDLNLTLGNLIHRTDDHPFARLERLSKRGEVDRFIQAVRRVK